MALDPKLRDVLDFLPCEPCLERPSADQEALCSICHRLNRTVALRCQVSLVTPESDAPSPEELEAAREEARLKQAEFEALQERKEADAEAVEQLRQERDHLLARQRELEDRLTRLEAQSHGGQITFVDDDTEAPVEEIVEFSRVDLGPAQSDDDEDVMEFESLGTEGSAFETPDEGAWEGTSWEEPAASWEEEEQVTPASGDETVSWDEGDETPQASYGEAEEAPWETVEEHAVWESEEPADEGRAHAETQVAGELEDLDEQTRADLSELEAQLEELESELAKRRPRKDDDADQ